MIPWPKRHVHIFEAAVSETEPRFFKSASNGAGQESGPGRLFGGWTSMPMNPLAYQ